MLLKHPQELTEMLATFVYELFQQANGPPSDELEQLLNTLRLKTSAVKVDEIQRTFLLQNRLHFEQHLFRLNEKSQALAQERDRLQKKLTEMHEEMEEMLNEYGQEEGSLHHTEKSPARPGDKEPPAAGDDAQPQKKRKAAGQ